MPDEEATIISVEELKIRLRLAGIDYSDYTDEDLQLLIDLNIDRIEAETGLPIKQPKLIDEYDELENISTYVLDYYPILCYKLFLDNKEITPEYVDYNKGILYFEQKLKGKIRIQYKIQFDDVVLLSDLITNLITVAISGDNINGSPKSIKEGDVSVTYDETTGLASKINNSFLLLKGYYKPRIRMF